MMDKARSPVEEPFVEEENLKALTKDAQIMDLRQQRDMLAAKCASLQAQLQALSVLKKYESIGRDPRDELVIASQENKAIKSVLDETCMSLHLLQEENIKLRSMLKDAAVTSQLRGDELAAPIKDVDFARKSMERAHHILSPAALCGIGVRLDSGRDRSVRVTEIFPGGAASKNETLREGDMIMEIDGKSIVGLSPEQVQMLIAGPENSDVIIKAQHRSGEVFEVSLFRSEPLKCRMYVMLPDRTDPEFWTVLADQTYAAAFSLRHRVERLDQRLRTSHAEVAELEAKNRELRDKVDKLQAFLKNIESKRPFARQSRSENERPWAQEADSSEAGLSQVESSYIEDDWDNRSSGSMRETDNSAGMCGVGLRITESAPFQVKDCQPGGPADRSGDIMPGDVLISVDGKQVANALFSDVRKLIVGKIGSAVEMRFLRTRGDERRTFLVTMLRANPDVTKDSKAHRGTYLAPPLSPALQAKGRSNLQHQPGQLKTFEVPQDDSSRALTGQEASPNDLMERLAECEANRADLLETVSEFAGLRRAVYEMYSAVCKCEIEEPGNDLGLKLTIFKGFPRIEKIVKGGLADTSKVMKVNDVLLSINGQTVSGLTLTEIEKMMSASFGSSVKVKGKHGDSGESYEVVLSHSKQQVDLCKSLCKDATTAAGSLHEEIAILRKDLSESNSVSAPVGQVRVFNERQDESSRALTAQEASPNDLMERLAECEANRADLLETVSEFAGLRRAVYEMYSAVCKCEIEEPGNDLGLKLTIFKGFPRIEKIVKGGLADTSKVMKVNDVLLSINGQTVSGLTLTEIEKMMSASFGSSVKVKGKHGDSGESYEVVLSHSKQQVDLCKSLCKDATTAAGSLHEEIAILRKDLSESNSSVEVLGKDCKSLESNLALAKDAMLELESRLKAALDLNSKLEAKSALPQTASAFPNLDAPGMVSQVCSTNDASVQKSSVNISTIETSLFELQAQVQSLESEKAALEQKVRGHELEALRARLSNAHQPQMSSYSNPEDDWESRSTYSSVIGLSEGTDECGVGLRLTEAAPFRVKDCQPGGAAQKSGEIRPGDVLISINSMQVTGMTFADVRKQLVGKVGSQIEMQFVRSRGDERRIFSVWMTRTPISNSNDTKNRQAPILQSHLSDGKGPALSNAQLSKEREARKGPEERSTSITGTNHDQHLDEMMSCINLLTSGVFGELPTSSTSSIGAALRKSANSQGNLHIDSLVKDGPAFRSGVMRAKDAIMSIDGRTISDLSVEEANQLLVGPTGSVVTIQGRHDDGEQYQVALIRGPAESGLETAAFEVTLDKKASDIGDADVFAAEILGDVARASGLQHSQVFLTTIRAGSIIAEFLVTGKGASAVLGDLEAQALNPSSLLRQGKHTKALKSIKKSSSTGLVSPSVVLGGALGGSKIWDCSSRGALKSRAIQARAAVDAMHEMLNSIHRTIDGS